MANVLMLLSNPFRPDIRPYQEALALMEKGHQVTLFAWDREGNYPEKEDVDGIHVERIRVKASKGLLFPFSLRKFHKEVLQRAKGRGFEVVHAHDFDTLRPATKLRVKGMKLVYDIHDIYSQMIRVDVSKTVAGFVQRMEDGQMRHADQIIVPCIGAKELYVGRGVSGEKISIVMNCKPWSGAEEERVSSLRKELQIREKFIIVYIGTFGERKFIPELVELSRDFSSEHLILGGYGDLEGFIENNLNEHISYVGSVYPNDVHNYLALADVGVCMYDPRMENQNIGIVSKFFDYVNVGVPCIVNEELRGTARVVRENDCGLVVPYGKEGFMGAVRRLEDDKGLSKIFRKNILALQKEYNWGVMKERLWEAYSRLND